MEDNPKHSAASCQLEQETTATEPNGEEKGNRKNDVDRSTESSLFESIENSNDLRGRNDPGLFMSAEQILHKQAIIQDRTSIADEERANHPQQEAHNEKDGIIVSTDGWSEEATGLLCKAGVSGEQQQRRKRRKANKSAYLTEEQKAQTKTIYELVLPIMMKTLCEVQAKKFKGRLRRRF
ncbi:hypothetical protein KP509_1Z135000 [Ceratopteris richardii]|nr:hypothetical protein KP509_1Z135000 [Ceratopteris richardii]